MRILYIVSLFPCWSETFIIREIDALMSMGVNVRIFSLKHPIETLVQSDAQNLTDRVIYPPRRQLSLASAITAFIGAPTTNAHLLGLIVKRLACRPSSMVKNIITWWRTLAALKDIAAWRPDFIHAHWATYPSTAAMVLSKNTNIPFSFTCHAHDIFLEHQLLNKKLEYASFAVTISHYNRRYLAKIIRPSFEQKTHVVHCGINLEELPYTRLHRDQCLLLSVGRLDEIKGFDILLHACKRLKDRGINYNCEIIGEGPLRRVLERQQLRLGLGQHVSLLGARPQEEIRAKLSQAAIFVLPSIMARNGNRDGIPVALIEAMASGTPVVTTTISGIPELVENGYSGFLTAPGDYEALANKISFLLENKGQQDFLARNARMRVEKDFVAFKEAARLFQLFQQHCRKKILFRAES